MAVTQAVNSAGSRAIRSFGLVVATGIAVGLSPGLATDARAQSAAQQDAWSESIANVPLPHAGCFTASYPDATWTEVPCVTAPLRPATPRHAWGNWTGTVGNGNDYMAVVAGHMTSAKGYFPIVSGLVKESGLWNGKTTPNSYTLQLNSNFMSGSPACAGAAVPADCLAWEQFVYSSDEQQAYMQYWLITYNNTCPAGWISTSGDCFVNSKAVSVPRQVITQLPYLKITASADLTGSDKLVMTTQTRAYSTTGPGTMVDLASGWTGAEFNVFGDCCSSEANFNPGTTITDRIDVNNGTTDTPVCDGGLGTTAETNNMNLGKNCKTLGGTAPFVSFTESRK